MAKLAFVTLFENFTYTGGMFDSRADKTLLITK